EGDSRGTRRASVRGQRTRGRVDIRDGVSERRAYCERERVGRRTGMNAILIAEDEERIAAFVSKGLKAAGLTPTVVDDGRTAYDYAMTGAFDLVVLDIGLPLEDGFSVLRRLREARNDIPVI